MEVLFYKRPQFVKPPGQPPEYNECQRYLARADLHSRIPPELSFENVIHDRAVNPCSLNDFMKYLRYIEHTAENLQFYLWLEQYTQRFEELPANARELSPEWNAKDAPPPPAPLAAPATTRTGTSTGGGNKNSSSGARVTINFEELANPFADQSSTQSSRGGTGGVGVGGGDAYSLSSTAVASATDAATEAQAGVGLKWQPFTIQPLREQATRAIAYFLAPGAPQELNLSHRDRAYVLHAIQHTTHPSAFYVAREIVLATLRRQSHPNFIRYGICNANRPRVWFARSGGYTHVFAGVIVAILLALSSASRWFRILATPLWFSGFAVLIASYLGLCLILQVSHVRTVNPWDLDATDEEDDAGFRKSEDDAITLQPSSPPATADRSDEFVEKHNKKSAIAKIRDKQVWIQNDSVRLLQDKLALQSYAWSALLTVIFAAGFVAIPPQNMF